MRRAALVACLLLVFTPGSASAEVEEVERYSSLAEMTRHADAVVLGRVVEAIPGRVFSGCGYTAATVEVDELLAGDLPSASRERLTLEYFGWCRPDLPQLGNEIPAERAVFFLRNKGVGLRQAKPDATPSEIDRETAFWRLVILAGTVVDRGGRVHVPEKLNAPYLARLEGSPFARFVDSIRAVAARAPDTATSVNDRQPSPPSVPLVALAAGLFAFLHLVSLEVKRTPAR